MTIEMQWPDAKVSTTHLGREGIALAVSEQPDVVLLDLGLPDTDGFEVLRQVRKISDVPVLILTAYGEDRDVTHALQLGANGYLVKPFRRDEIVARIRALVDNTASG
jgi:two-component system KDP operon response regulator KdpE